jgi:colicin import membrane protein
VLPPGVPDSARAEYSMTMIPGGEVLSVKLRKSIGYPAYDAAIERAINAAAPLPVPSDPNLFQQLRELNLVFRPN